MEQLVGGFQLQGNKSFRAQHFGSRKGDKPDDAQWESFRNYFFDVAKTVGTDNVAILDSFCV